MKKFDMQILRICPRHLSDVATLPWEIKKSFSAVFFIHTFDYLRYLRRKVTVTHLPTPSENVTTITCDCKNFNMTERLLRSFKVGDFEETLVGCHRWL